MHPFVFRPPRRQASSPPPPFTHPLQEESSMQLFHAFGRIACALACALLLAGPAMADGYKQEYKLSVVPSAKLTLLLLMP